MLPTIEARDWLIEHLEREREELIHQAIPLQEKVQAIEFAIHSLRLESNDAPMTVNDGGIGNTEQL